MPLGKEVGLGPGHIVLDGDPVGTKRCTAAPPHFWPMPIVAKRSPISATAELLLDNRLYKCSPVDEMGDCLATIDMDQKEGVACALSGGPSLGLTMCPCRGSPP